MTAVTLPNVGIKSGFTVGESGWSDEMNLNLRLLDALVLPTVVDKDQAAPVGGEIAGDIYIVTAGTGVWASQNGKLAILQTGDDLTSAWVFVTPREGWRVWVADELAFYQYTSGAWVMDETLTPFSGVYDDLTGKPTLFTGVYDDLTGKPTLFTGAYGDLSGLPALFNGDYGSLTSLPTLFTGVYDDLTGKPTLFSGVYADLTDKPTYITRRIQTVTDATGAVTCDWSLYDEIRLTLVGDVTLTFSGAADGQSCMLKLKQDATGSRLVTLPGSARFSADITAFVATTTASKIDRISFLNDAGDGTYDLLSVIKGLE